MIEGNSDSPAFPGPDKMNNCLGLTKREYFAAMAMQGILSGDYLLGVLKTNQQHNDAAAHLGEGCVLPQESLATSAVGFADALMKELEKKC